jgi:hypothetical protein
VKEEKKEVEEKEKEESGEERGEREEREEGEEEESKRESERESGARERERSSLGVTHHDRGRGQMVGSEEGPTNRFQHCLHPLACMCVCVGERGVDVGVSVGW